MGDLNINFQHSYDLRLASGGDKQAPGAAITVGLCGHWDHEGPCRWPHHSTVTHLQADDFRLTVDVTCKVHERSQVLDRLRQAILGGELVGPDGRLTRWKLLGTNAH